MSDWVWARVQTMGALEEAKKSREEEEESRAEKRKNKMKKAKSANVKRQQEIFHESTIVIMTRSQKTSRGKFFTF